MVLCAAHQLFVRFSIVFSHTTAINIHVCALCTYTMYCLAIIINNNDIRISVEEIFMTARNENAKVAQKFYDSTFIFHCIKLQTHRFGQNFVLCYLDCVELMIKVKCQKQLAALFIQIRNVCKGYNRIKLKFEKYC